MLKELWFNQDMNKQEQIMAVGKLILGIGVLLFVLSGLDMNVLGMIVISMCILYIYYKLTEKMDVESETFIVQDKGVHENEDIAVLYNKPNRKNPYNNVLLTDIMDNPDKLPALPSFNNPNIQTLVKQTIQRLNPDIINTTKQLFGNKWELFLLDRSNRQFYSMPNTRVCNDQGAFADYLYADLKYSGKENTEEGRQTRVQDSIRWIMR